MHDAISILYMLHVPVSLLFSLYASILLSAENIRTRHNTQAQVSSCTNDDAFIASTSSSFIQIRPFRIQRIFDVAIFASASDARNQWINFDRWTLDTSINVGHTVTQSLRHFEYVYRA